MDAKLEAIHQEIKDFHGRLCSIEESKKRYKWKRQMEWVQTLSIIATIVAGAYYMHRDIKEDMKTQTARTDKLYEMFIDLLKELRK